MTKFPFPLSLCRRVRHRGNKRVCYYVYLHVRKKTSRQRGEKAFLPTLLHSTEREREREFHFIMCCTFLPKDSAEDKARNEKWRSQLSTVVRSGARIIGTVRGDFSIKARVTIKRVQPHSPRLSDKAAGPARKRQRRRRGCRRLRRKRRQRRRRRRAAAPCARGRWRAGSSAAPAPSARSCCRRIRGSVGAPAPARGRGYARSLKTGMPVWPFFRNVWTTHLLMQYNARRSKLL